MSLETLQKMNKLDEHEFYQACVDENVLLKEFIDSGKVTAEQLKHVGELAVQASAEFGVHLSCNIIEHRKESQHLSVNYKIDRDTCDAETICDMNFALADKLIDHGLEGLPVVTQFSRIKLQEASQN